MFNRHFRTNSVSGWDGGVGFVFSSRNPFFPAGLDHPVQWDSNRTFRRLKELTECTRTPGQVIRTRNDPRSNWHYRQMNTVNNWRGSWRNRLTGWL